MKFHAPLDNVKKIGVLRANAIGDFVFILPALEALKHTYPDAELVLFGLPWHKEFLQGRPGPVDRVEIVPYIEGLRPAPPHEATAAASATLVGARTHAQNEFFERMRDEHFDIAIQMHGGGRHSNPFIRSLRPRLSVGSKATDALPLDRWIPYFLYHKEVLRYLEVVALVGARPVTLEPQLNLIARDIIQAQDFIEDDKPFIVLHPGATDPRRRWPAKKFAETGDHLASLGYRIIINGVASEYDVIQDVMENMKQPVQYVGPNFKLGGLLALLAHARLVVSNDSGPIHLAGAVNTPSVGLFWVGNCITGGPISLGSNRPQISFRICCPECGQDCTVGFCAHRVSFVADISSAEVLKAAEDLLLQRALTHQGVFRGSELPLTGT